MQVDDPNFLRMLKSVEHELGRPLSDEERSALMRVFTTHVTESIRARHLADAAAPFLAYIRRLKDRQGTKIIDFDALYRSKIELDKRLYGNL